MPKGFPGTKQVKFCACGCGEETSAPWRKWKLGHKAHGICKRTGRPNYKMVWCVMCEKRQGEHVVLAEKALGRPLNWRKGEVVHHINLNKRDNRPQNLIICNRSYHDWLHYRMQELYVKKCLAHL